LSETVSQTVAILENLIPRKQPLCEVLVHGRRAANMIASGFTGVGSVE
jgi:hypothetical protein